MSKFQTVDVASIESLRVTRKADNIILEIPIDNQDAAYFLPDDRFGNSAEALNKLRHAIKNLRDSQQLPISIEFRVPIE